jgi:hypothetical protein
MVEEIELSSVFQNWERTESIIRKNLEGQIPPEQENEVICRFREIYDRLPSRLGRISLRLDGLENLTAQDMDSVYSALGSAVDQIQQELQTFAGHVLGEIFGLVLEMSRADARLHTSIT